MFLSTLMTVSIYHNMLSILPMGNWPDLHYSFRSKEEREAEEDVEEAG